MNAPLSFSEFESWLSALPDDTPVGVTCMAGNCPISVWATERVGRSVLVDTRKAVVLYDEGDEKVLLDEGLAAFVDYVDGCWPDSEISAGQARTACAAVRESLNS